MYVSKSSKAKHGKEARKSVRLDFFLPHCFGNFRQPPLFLALGAGAILIYIASISFECGRASTRFRLFWFLGKP
jgi:hypothetical protein